MKYFSTNGSPEGVSFRKALFYGLAPDGGLYMPENIPVLNPAVFHSADSFTQLAFDIIRPFVRKDIPDNHLYDISKAAFTFDVPLKTISEQFHILELFHGPTLAFKDFAARFMARTLEYFQGAENKELTILVATSGDTGSAVAHGFFGAKGIRVVILYPSGRVSNSQEKQLTTLGGNVTALEVEGNFDDCQRMVKEAFLDRNLQKERRLSSANSINIGRLLPQSVYYGWAWKQLNINAPVIFSVPCGNFGNLTGGLLAKRMGLPVKLFIAATNENDVFPEFLSSGEYHPMPSKQTLSNAMDVGKPSNLERIMQLYDHNLVTVREAIKSWSFTDNETKKAIRETYESTGYLPDPHTAVGILGRNRFQKEFGKNDESIVIATAHPGKFADLVNPIINDEIPIPNKLLEAMEKKKKAILIQNHYSQLKEFLLTS